MITRFLTATLVVVAAGTSSNATDVVGGTTTVFLDTATLSSAAGLDFSGVSAGVIALSSPDLTNATDVSDLSADSISLTFGINPRDAAPPTTFSYDPSDFLGTFSGTIEHTGSVFFNTDTVEVGDFTIGFDIGRQVGLGASEPSGFFVESTTGVAAILFDIAGPTTLDPQGDSLTIGANLLVSPEFATFLGDTGLTGADVGDALVQANAIPEPAAAMLLLMASGMAVACRRR